MNHELEHRSAVATERCRTVVVVGTGGVVNRVEERHLLTFQYILVDGVEVRLVNGEDERMDAITTVLSRQGVTVDTLLGKVLILIEVVRTLADRYTCGIEYRIVDNEAQTVEHLYAVDNGCVIAVDASRVERSDLTIPLIDPLIRQVVRTDDYGSIHERMNNDFQYRGAVTTVRGETLLGVNRVGREDMIVKGNRLSFYNVLLAVAVVRFVDCEVQDRDGVTTVSTNCGVVVNTGLVEVQTLEGVEVIVALTDTVVDGDYYRLVDDES